LSLFWDFGKDKQNYSIILRHKEKLLSAADVKMQAMIWLGLNCAFGCTDCGKLKWKDLDLKHGRVRLPRNKTGTPRDFPLWPETIQALKELPRPGPLVFYTSQGQPWVTTVVKNKSNGQRE